MAEGENKGEKKVVEMNIWFIVLLIVLIISVACTLSMNTKLKASQDQVAELEQKVSTLQKTNSDRAKLITDLTKMAVDGSISQKLVLEKLNEAGYDINNLPAINEPVEVSGEEEIPMEENLPEEELPVVE